VVNAKFLPLYPWERDQVPTVQEAAWTPEPVWTGKVATKGLQSPDRTVRSEWLYRPSYRGPLLFFTVPSITFIVLPFKSYKTQSFENNLLLNKNESNLTLCTNDNNIKPRSSS